tara:strand:+ start:134 stop:1183 length:1050 start_codon:yes stop_codon:yes gene_type:complete
MNIINSDISDFIVSDGLIIDVRSPEEYYKGHMPNSINIPLFNDIERAIVGKKYKVSGRKHAVLEGLSIIEKKLNQLIEDLSSANEKNNLINNEETNEDKILKIYCARGGMRSQSISWLLHKMRVKAVTLKGGYKSYRNYVLNMFLMKTNYMIIGGKTGTGKTRILNILKEHGYQTIDLEHLANHRGSSFGGLGMKSQPSNEQFENLIADELKKFNKKETIYLEAESANIGKCRIPFELFKRMKESPRIEIINSKENRIKELINTYSKYPSIELIESVEKISRRLGPQRTKSAKESIDKKDWEGVCEAVLDYYDKCYEYELINSDRDVKYINLKDKGEELIVFSIINIMN